MLTGFSEALRGSGGNYELNRVVGLILALGFVIGALAFTAWNMIEGEDFDVVAFCGAYAAGAAVLTGGTAGAIALKDRNVASSEIIRQTGAVPTKAPAGPRVPVGDPPPVDSSHGQHPGADAPADDAGLPEGLR